MKLARRVLARSSLILRALRCPIGSLALLAPMVGCDDGPPSATTDLKASADMAVAPTRYGFVRAGATSFNSGTQANAESMASALFLDTISGSPGCTRSVQGDCVMYRCTGTSFLYPGAGSVSVNPKGTGGFSLSPSTDGYYVEQRNTSAAVFAPGQAVSVVTTGKDVPKFEGEVTLPSDMFSIISPNASRSNLGWLISKSADFPISWTPTTSKVIVELVQGTDQAYGGTTIRCTFSGTAGTGKLPASLLGNLKTTAGVVNHILVGPSASTQVRLPGWEVEVLAIGIGRGGDVTIQ